MKSQMLLLGVFDCGMNVFTLYPNHNKTTLGGSAVLKTGVSVNGNYEHC